MEGVAQQRERQSQKDFGADGQVTWRTILQEHSKVREDQVVDLFHRGLHQLKISPNHIPSLEEINKTLRSLTGFQGVLVNGLEEGRDFYKLLAARQFPIGNFIRDKRDLNYTPEPDIVHDLYGHLPFFTDQKYADFCQRFGELACEFINREDLLRQFERFFWFTIEFGLIQTKDGVRVFGAGIASSIGECTYALSGEPKVVPFDVDAIRQQEFRIDQMQKKLFLIESTQQLYGSLDELYKKVKADQ